MHFLTKIWIFDQSWIFDQNLDFDKILDLSQKFVCFFAKILLLHQNFDLCFSKVYDKCTILAKNNKYLIKNSDYESHDIKLFKICNKESVPMIFICTTLWHEEDNEMRTLLTSLLRLIHYVRLRKQDTTLRQQDRFNLEINILFDNVFESHNCRENPNKTLPSWLPKTPFFRRVGIFVQNLVS